MHVARADRTFALPPLNRALARHLVERTSAGRDLAALGTRGEGRDALPGDGQTVAAAGSSEKAFDGVVSTLVRLSQIAVDQGAIVELEIDPLLAGHDAVVAACARIRVRAGMPPGEERLSIRPYPRELEGSIELRDGRRLPIRPIRPEDEPRLQEAFEHLTPEDVRLRFFSPLRVLHHDLAAQLTQIDYDRAMAFVVLEPPGDAASGILGVARLTADPDSERAEYAVTVRSDWQGRGLGHALIHKILDYGRAKGLRELFGHVLRDNQSMLALSRELGFTVKSSSEGPDILHVSLLLDREPEDGSRPSERS